jgi:sulfate permease, SulP family
LILSGVHTQPLYAMTQAGIFDLFGEESIHVDLDDALDRARIALGLPKLGRPKDFVLKVKNDMEGKK